MAVVQHQVSHPEKTNGRRSRLIGAGRRRVWPRVTVSLAVRANGVVALARKLIEDSIDRTSFVDHFVSVLPNWRIGSRNTEHSSIILIHGIEGVILSVNCGHNVLGVPERKLHMLEDKYLKKTPN